MKFDIKKFVFVAVGLFGFSYAHALPNPASQNCVTLGGELKMVKDATGSELGLCTFGKASLEEWTLMRSKNDVKSQLALSAYCSSRNTPVSEITNQETHFCKILAGTPLDVQTAEGETVKLCKFEDNSTIEQWTLYYGPSHVRNSALKDAVSCN